MLQVAGGDVRVADAKGAPPTLPFWLGEAPARSDELSRAVSDLRAALDRRLEQHPSGAPATDWVMAETGLDRDAADQAVSYLAEGRRALGVDSDAGHARARAILRRVRRHAAGPACAVRQSHQQGLGPRPAQALLPAVQFRAAGGRDRRRADALARAAALVPAVGRVPLPAPRDDTRRAGAGVSQRAGVQDAVAVEHDDLAGRAARAGRAQSGGARSSGCWRTT